MTASAQTTLASAATVHLFDRSARLRMHFTGAKAAESLTGLVTNDVLALRGGDGQYACALTPKGRIIADVRILAIAGADGTVLSLLVDANAAAGAGFAAMIRKYVNPRVATYVDVTTSTACVTLVGDESLSLLGTLGASQPALAEVATGPSFTHRPLSLAGVSARVARIPDLGSIDAFDLHCESTDAPTLLAALQKAGATLSDAAAWNRQRVMAGRPEWGVDMDETTLAQEANMDTLHAISYQKGCYTGQETVARVHFRGHVNRTLRRVRFTDGTAPAPGSSLLNVESATVGDARSSALIDDGQLMGIAMLRREVPDASELTWMDQDATRHAVLVIGAPDDG